VIDPDDLTDLDLPALLSIGLTEAEGRAVLQGQPQLHRDELADRLEMHRRELEGRLA
jgi:hypothetical protein